MKTPEEIQKSCQAKVAENGRTVTDADMLIEYLQTRYEELHHEMTNLMNQWAKFALASPEQLRKWADDKESILSSQGAD